MNKLLNQHSVGLRIGHAAVMNISRMSVLKVVGNTAKALNSMTREVVLLRKVPALMIRS